MLSLRKQKSPPDSSIEADCMPNFDLRQVWGRGKVGDPPALAPVACWWAGVQSSIPISQHGVDLLNSHLLSPIERTQSAAHWGGASCASPRNLLRSRSAGLDSAAPNPHDPCTSEHTCTSERMDSVPHWLPPSQLPPLLPSIRAWVQERASSRIRIARSLHLLPRVSRSTAGTTVSSGWSIHGKAL